MTHEIDASDLFDDGVVRCNVLADSAPPSTKHLADTIVVLLCGLQMLEIVVSQDIILSG